MGSVELLTQQARLQGVLEPGSTFGVYIVRDCIGEGGMARIYRAEHAGLRRQVALKVLINGFAREPEGRERFVREARIAAAIKHPNVVNIFDVGVYEDVPYLVMELLEGTDLESLVQSKGPLEENMIVDIMVPIVAGLAAVHEAGIVHRDLKPGNIFLSRGRYEELEPKLLDFGISKVADGEQAKLTMNGLLMGTPFYMSPEGLRGDEMTPLSDQYSLGVVMYECVTGRAPFTPSSFPELAKQITTGQYLTPTQHNPSVSKRLERIIQRAMSLDPKDRYTDLRELGRQLLLLAGQRTRITWGLSFGEPGHTKTMGSAVSPPDSIPNFRPRNWRKPVAAIVALLALLFVVGLSVSSQKESDGTLDKPRITTAQKAAIPAPIDEEKIGQRTSPADSQAAEGQLAVNGAQPSIAVQPASAQSHTAQSVTAQSIAAQSAGQRILALGVNPAAKSGLPGKGSPTLRGSAGKPKSTKASGTTSANADSASARSAAKTGAAKPLAGANGAPIFD